MSLIQVIKIAELVKSGEASLQTGPFGTQLKASDYVEHGVPVINVRNIGFGDIRQDNLEFLNEVMTEKMSAHKLKRGDIVFGRKGAVERHAFIKDIGVGWIQGSDCLRLRINSDRIDNQFVSYFFKTHAHQDWMQAVCSFGATMASLNQDIVKLITIPLPPLNVQRKIAGILSAYDDLIENNKRRIALLEKMAEELYREWFVRFRFPGWREAEFEKGIPKGWSQIPLGEIANILMGQSPASEFYNTDGHGLPFHQGVGTYGDRFPKNENYCSVSGRTANEGDILFSVRAPVGRLNIASEKMIIGRGLSAIRHKENCQSYLFYLLKSAFASEDIIGNGSIFNSVGKDELIGFKLFKPKQDLIEAFEKKVSAMDKQIAILLKSVRKLQETKNALLPRLISGRLAVEDLAVQLPPSMRENV